MAVMLMAGTLFSACSNGDDAVTPTPTAGYTLTLEATKQGPTTRTLTPNGSTLKATWNKGDSVEVWTADKKLGIMKAQQDGATTTLKGQFNTAPVVGDVLTFKYLSPDYEKQDGTLTGSATSIDKTCDYATAMARVTKVDGSNVVTSPGSLTFTNQQTIVKITLKNDDGSAEVKASKLLITADANQLTVTPSSAQSEFYVAMPAIESAGFTVLAEDGNTRHIYTTGDATFESGKFYPIDVKTTKVDIKMLPLYYVTRTNMGIFFELGFFEDTPNAGYFFTWDQAMDMFAAQTTSYNTYKNVGSKETIFSNTPCHLPIRDEWCSILPYYTGGATIWHRNVYSTNLGRAVWGYNAQTKKGITEASLWRTASKTEMHAVRFLGTPYCSAWKYEELDGYLRVSATLIGQLPANQQEVTKWYNKCFFNVTFADDESKLSQQRDFYMLGWAHNASGSASYFQGTSAAFWSATADDDLPSQAWIFEVWEGGSLITCNDKGHGFNVRLFLDN